MNFVIPGLLVVLVIGFFVVVWKAAQDWRWYNIVAVCFTMLLTVAFLFPTAGVLRSRSAWHKIKEELERREAQVRSDYVAIKYGDPENPQAGKGVVELDQELNKLGIEAGRRWRNLQLQNATNTSITLAMDPQAAGQPTAGVPTAADPAAAATADPSVPNGLVVYGFAELAAPNSQQLLPRIYLGEFRVTASTPTQVTLSPTGPLEPKQVQAISQRQASSWSLYEMLPLDGHEPFIAEGSESTDENYLGRVDEQLLAQLLENNVREETLEKYQRDGSRALPDDVPISIWTKIEFLKPYSMDVDSPDQRAALDGGFFDDIGRAVDARLQRGEDGKINFGTGDQVLVKQERASELISEQTAKLVDNYYLRPLNDYRFVLRRIRLRLQDLASRMEELKFEEQVLQDAVDKTENMLVKNQDIKLKLEQDAAQFRVEKNALQQYTSSLQQGLQNMRREMLRLHQENIALEKKLKQMHMAVERRFDLTMVD